MNERRRSPWWIVVLALVGALSLVVGALAAAVLGVVWVRHRIAADETADAQSAFYSAVADVPATPGTLIRSEPLEYSVVGGKGWRVVYTSIDGQGRPVAVSGRIFVPDAPAPAGGRKVVAWAHGTVGLASSCAPSRATTYTDLGFLAPALQRGWVVVATDYAGLGMPGAPTYLIGEQEARDVVNSVRLARAFPDSGAGREWIVYGASQGGHASLWTAARAASIAPELRLVAVGAAVPAAELAAIMHAQWSTVIGWVIGPDALASWSVQHPDRDYTSALTPLGREVAARLADQCILETGIEALGLHEADGPLFTADPLTFPAWAASVASETPPQPPKGMAMYLAQGMADNVVLPGSNALLQDQWCAAGVTIASSWLSGVSHSDTSVVAGPTFIDWAVGRFAGQPAPSTCALGVPAPVTPLPVPSPSP